MLASEYFRRLYLLWGWTWSVSSVSPCLRGLRWGSPDLNLGGLGVSVVDLSNDYGVV